MAKRGYRGKHPYNDMKVADGENAAANNDKLTDEYNNTGAKNKYDYIDDLSESIKEWRVQNV